MRGSWALGVMIVSREVAAPSVEIARDRSERWIAVLVAAVGFVVYLNSLAGGFVSDDRFLILEHPYTRDAGLMPRIFTAGHYAGQGGYRPLVTLSFSLNHLVGGLEPKGYHLVNVLLHAVNSALVFLLVLRLFDSRVAAGMAGALFAAHPIHAEAVAWISGRAELLGAAMFLAGWLLYLRATMGGRLRSWPFAASLAAFFLGLLCKEHVLVLPVALLLTEVLRARATGEAVGARWISRGALWRCAAYIAVALAYFAFRHALYERPFMRVPSQIGHYDNPLVSVGPLERACTAVCILGDYVRLLVWPRVLSADYSFDQVRTAGGLGEPAVIAALLVLLALLLCGGLSFWRGGRAWFGIAFFFLSVVPTSNLLVLIGVIQAERLLYLPSLGFCMVAGLLWARAWEGCARRVRRGAVAVVGAAALLGLAARTLARNADWRDEATLWKATAETAPRSVKAQINHGDHLLKEGKTDGAIAAFRKALSIDAGSEEAILNLGAALARKGAVIEAVTLYRGGVVAHPDCAALHLNLGVLEAGLGDLLAAEASFRRAVALAPTNAVARFNLALALSRRDQLDEAVREYCAAVEADPEYPDAWNGLGAVYMKKGGLREAKEAVGRALSLRPDYEDALHNMRLIRDRETGQSPAPRGPVP